jgi:hypothetical protein
MRGFPIYTNIFSIQTVPQQTPLKMFVLPALLHITNNDCSRHETQPVSGSYDLKFFTVMKNKT